MTDNQRKARLRHGIPWCERHLPVIRTEGGEFRCGCNRLWRVVEGRWKLVLYSAGFSRDDMWRHAHIDGR